MTETQRKFLTEYLGDEWLPGFQFDVFNRTFTTAQDKQDLLEAVIKHGEFNDFLYSEFRKTLYVVSDIIQLSPEATAELICRWKGVE
jgi:hypothetical protein